MKMRKLMKKISSILTITIILGMSVSPPAHAAKDCSGLSDAVPAAEAAVTGLIASAASANSAVLAATSRLNTARLPAQRVSAQVALMREQKTATKVRSALSAAKNVLRSARLSLANCK